MPAWRQRTKKSQSPPPRKLPVERRAHDQAIAAAIDQRHRTGVVVGGTEGGMAREPGLAVVVEHRQHRPADHVGTRRLRGANHQFEPVGRGDLVVVDHQEARCGGKQRLRRFERGVDRLAIALPLLDQADTLELAGGEKFRGNRRALTLSGVILDHHHREGTRGTLVDQRLQRQTQMLRTSEAGNADDDADREVDDARARGDLPVGVAHGIRDPAGGQVCRDQRHGDLDA
jgi:hypothetical protein